MIWRRKTREKDLGICSEQRAHYTVYPQNR